MTFYKLVLATCLLYFKQKYLKTITFLNKRELSFFYTGIDSDLTGSGILSASIDNKYRNILISTSVCDKPSFKTDILFYTIFSEFGWKDHYLFSEKWFLITSRSFHFSVKNSSDFLLLSIKSFHFIFILFSSATFTCNYCFRKISF